MDSRRGDSVELDEEPTEIATPLFENLPAGTTLGEYRIEQRIAEGAMGVVYAATHPVIGKRAAIKVLREELCRSEVDVERFIDEARVVNRIGHPNIVDVFAFGQTADGRSYFVMEWLDGESLAARIARSPLTMSEITQIIRPLVRALAAAHDAGVVHRDLKPDNVFLVEIAGEAPGIKLLDFGIAKLAGEHAPTRPTRTATGAIVGTPQYIAPEQAKGIDIDASVDVYALGVIVFEMLAGRPPYLADTAMEMVAKHLMEPVPRPSAFVAVPPELDDLVVNMLAKEPRSRPSLGDVRAVLARLEPGVHGALHTPVPMPRAASPVWYPPETAFPPVVPALPAPVPRPRSRVFVIGLLVFALATAVAFLVVRQLAGHDAEPVASPDVPQDHPSTAAAEPTAPPAVDDPIAPPSTPTAEDRPDPSPRPIDPGVDRSAGSSSPPVVPARPRTAWLHLDIVGPAAPTILVDQQPAKSSTPLYLGRHVVEISAPGFQPQKLVLVVANLSPIRRRIELRPIVRPPQPELMQPRHAHPELMPPKR